MGLWHFSSSVNTFFKSAYAAILWGYMSDIWSNSSSSPYFMCANSEASGETAQMPRLAWAFAGRLCDKYHNLMSSFNVAGSFIYNNCLPFRLFALYRGSSMDIFIAFPVKMPLEITFFDVFFYSFLWLAIKSFDKLSCTGFSKRAPERQGVRYFGCYVQLVHCFLCVCWNLFSASEIACN